MSINLFEHNLVAYENAVSMLFNCKKAAIIHPTGTGKSFIGFKLCEDNPKKLICWLTPSEYIFKTQIENIKKDNPDFNTDNIIFLTYSKLMFMNEDEIFRIKPDYIILDEFHRAGATEWGKGVQRLLNIYKDIPVLGLSATAIRYLDNRRNMADELFSGNIASEITLGEAVVRGILNPPKYVLSVFSYKNSLDKYRVRINNAKNKASKDQSEKYFEALRRALDKADDVDVIFKKHMTDTKGKYIVFCANKERMEEMIDKSPKWFGKIDSNPHIYSFYSEDKKSETEFENFKNDNSEHLKLLYCIDALNEGIHIDDISGVILLRPTVSPIIYKQQIGRALSAGGKNAVIFDIVLNIENLFSIDAIEEEMQIATTYYRSLGEDNLIINEHFKIIDEVRDCLELFEKLNESLSASWDCMFSEAQKYYDENGNLDVPKRYVTNDGYTLGLWIGTQRRVHAGKVNGILTTEQIEKLESIGMIWENKQDVLWQKFYDASKQYYMEHGNLLVPVSDKRMYGVKLGRWITNIRLYRKSGIKNAYLTPERIKQLNDIGMVWDVYDYLWEQNYHAAVLYYREYGNLKMNSRYVTKDGIRLGAWIHSIRNTNKCTAEQIEKLNELGMVWDVSHNSSWEKSYSEAKLYIEKNNNLNIPASTPLGRWIYRQKTNKKLSEEKIKKLKDIGIIWGETKQPKSPKNTNSRNNMWESHYNEAKRYSDEHGSIKGMPKEYTDSTGVCLGRWIIMQRKKYKDGTLTKSQISKLTKIGMKWEIEDTWSVGYKHAKEYFEKNGNINVPKKYETKDGFKLYSWVNNNLSKYRYPGKRGTLTENQITLLNEIGFSVR